MHLPLSYQLDPGCDADGVTVTVPVEGLGQLTDTRLEWLVPGLLEQKVLALIRALPKNLRRHFVPAPDTAKLVYSDLEFGKGDLLTGVASRLSQLGGERFDSREFDLSTIADHLKFNICVVDDQRKKIIEGRELKDLRATLIQRSQAAFASAEKSAAVSGPSPEEAKWTRTGFKAWDWFDIPEHIEIKRAGMLLRSFPTLRDDGETVGLMLCQTPEEASRILRKGLQKLILIAERKRILIQIGNMPQIGQVKLLSSSIKGLELMNHLSLLMVERAWLSDQPLARTKGAFDRTLQRGRERLGVIAQEFVQFMPHLFQQYHETRRTLDQTRGPGWDHLLNSMKTQLTALVHPAFLIETPWPWLIRRLLQTAMPRFLRAATTRRRLPEFDRDPPFVTLPETSAPSRLALSSMARVDPVAEAVMRRRNAGLWAAALAGRSDLRPFLDAGPGAPYRFVAEATAGSAAALYDGYRARGCPVESWPDLAPEVLSDPAHHAVAIGLRRRLLFLPVHSGVTGDDIRRWTA